MKNYIEEPANLRSFSELAARLEAGEVFYDEDGDKYWFDASEANPFRFEDQALNYNWDRFPSLKIRRKINWWEVEGVFPAWCFVSDEDVEAKDRGGIIVLISNFDNRFFESSGGMRWRYARPASMEELKQYIKA